MVEKHPFYRQEIVDGLTAKIMKGQTLALDAVSGATVSSKAFLKAVENALASR